MLNNVTLDIYNIIGLLGKIKLFFPPRRICENTRSQVAFPYFGKPELGIL